jgi:hypothetical protein
MAEIAGLTLITPSSVAGSGVSLSGAKVVFTAATTISINGVFSATHDNYLMVMRHHWPASTSEGLYGRLRAGGSDNSTASSYVYQQLYVDNTTVGGARTTTNQWRISDVATAQRSGTHFWFYGPALAQPTAFRSVCVTGRSNAFIDDIAGTHNQSTSYDGITMTVNSSSLDGSLTIYGLSQ